MQTSVDGTVWTNQNNVSQNPINGITYGNNIFVAVGDQGTILTSSDLESWNEITTTTSYNFKEVAYGKNKFVAVGEWGMLFVSSDNDSWTKIESGTTANINNVIYAQNKFIAIGYDGLILTSENGDEWSENTSTEINGNYFRPITNEPVVGDIYRYFQYDKNRHTEFVGSIDSNGKNGVWSKWWGNGNKRSEGVYINSVKHGFWTEWKINGEKYEKKRNEERK